MSNEMTEQWSQFNIARLLHRAGEDLTREGLEDTPRRVESAWNEILEGYSIDPEAVLETIFENESGLGGLQLCRDISFMSVCEHHLLPFFGTVDIAIEANDVVVGLSKLPRLVDCYTKRLQIQERMTFQITKTLFIKLNPHRVAVVCKADHLCCKGRGVRRTSMKFETVSHLGPNSRVLVDLLLGN